MLHSSIVDILDAFTINLGSPYLKHVFIIHVKWSAVLFIHQKNDTKNRPICILYGHTQHLSSFIPCFFINLAVKQIKKIWIKEKKIIKRRRTLKHHKY